MFCLASRHFFGGDSYILLYSYTKAGSRSEEHIIYFWLGNDSTADEKGAAALLTVQLDGECLSVFLPRLGVCILCCVLDDW